MTQSVFQQSALASGLLTQEEIDEAVESVRASSSKPTKPVSDERLAGALVSEGRLNRWQAEQLRAGRIDFKLGAYQIIDSIGRGGMGEVYQAEHSVMGRVVAVKWLPKHKATPETIASFEREIRTQAQLDHENLVRAYDAGHDKSYHFLVMEYVPGTDLRRLVRRQGKLNMQVAAAIITQAARALAYAHARGLIHRDVKPGNLLVTPDGHTKVSDLGLAGYFHEEEETQAGGGKVAGTADYLAPEQIMSPDRLTPASDVYALGCTLYYAVTGKVPFPGGTVQEKARAHCKAQPLDPRRLNPDLSDEFVEVIADMMAKDPAERIQTAGEVIERLAAWTQRQLPAVGQEAARAVSMPQDDGSIHRPIPPAMSDTEPNFLMPPAEEPGQGESPSQMSLGTMPGTVGIEETVPLFTPRRARRKEGGMVGELSPLVKLLILVGMVTAAGTLLAVVGGLIYRALAT